MNILVYGAGVIGSVYAARLQEAGYNVSLLARGQRAVSLRTQGILLEDASTGHHTTTRVSIVDHLAPTDSYDVVIVTVRLDQLVSVLPDLAANHQIPTVLFMLNNPAGMQRFAWLKTHAIMVSCITAAVVMTKRNSAQLGRTRKHVVMMLQAIREGLLALQAQGISITPFSMKVLFLWMPRWLTVILCQYILRTPIAALGIDPHLNTAIEELRQMAREIMAQLQKSPLSTPTLSHLIAFLETPAGGCE